MTEVFKVSALKPKQESYKHLKTATALYQALVILLSQKVNNPYLKNIRLTRVVLSKDHRVAKVYFLLVDPNNDNNIDNKNNIENILSHCEKTAGFLQKQLFDSHQFTYIPKLNFYYDESEKKAEYLNYLLEKINQELIDQS